MNKSISSTVFLKILPVLGSITLFLAWVFQQTLLGNANNALQRIYTAQSVFQTYQSNNALFNAMLETSKSDSETISKVRSMQIYNYDLGLRELEALLTGVEKVGIPEQPNPFSGPPDTETKMAILQSRINTIQGRLEAKKTAITMQKAIYNSVFLLLYVFGTVTVLLGTLLNAFASSRSAESQKLERAAEAQPKS